MYSTKRASESRVLRSHSAKRRRFQCPNLEDILSVVVLKRHVCSFLYFEDHVSMMECSRTIRHLMSKYLRNQSSITILPVGRRPKEFSNFCKKYLADIRSFEMYDNWSENVYYATPANSWVSVLKNCQRLTRVTLTSSNFALNSENLGLMRNLTDLNLGFLSFYVLEKPIKPKKRLPLGLQESSDLSGLRELTKLKKFGLNLVNIDENIISYVSEMKNLEQLGLQFEDYNLASLKPLDDLSALKSLHIVPIKGPESEMDYGYTCLESNLQLKELIIGHHGYEMAYSNVPIAKNSEEPLPISNNEICLFLGLDLEASLESLKIFGCRILSHDVDENIIEFLPNLRSLTLTIFQRNIFPLNNQLNEKLEEINFYEQTNSSVLLVAGAAATTFTKFAPKSDAQDPVALKALNIYSWYAADDLRDAKNSLTEGEVKDLENRQIFETTYNLRDEILGTGRLGDLSNIDMSGAILVGYPKGEYLKTLAQCHHDISKMMERFQGTVNIKSPNEFSRSPFE